MPVLLLQRLASFAATLAVASALVFAVLELLPGNAAQIILGESATAESLAALEKQLGIELFVRSRQGMRPTMPAMQFLEPAQAMHRAMHQLGVNVAARDEGLQGLVRITASVSLASFVLPELLGALRSLQPGIRFEIIATDSHSDLLKREALHIDDDGHP